MEVESIVHLRMFILKEKEIDKITSPIQYLLSSSQLVSKCLDIVVNKAVKVLDTMVHKSIESLPLQENREPTHIKSQRERNKKKKKKY